MTAPSKIAPTLYGIIAFKLIRGALLLMIAMQVYALVGEELRPHFDEAVKRLRLDPETEFFGWAATGALLYGLLSVTEGVGLAFRTRWAGLMVVVESGFFVPLETYSLIKHPTPTILAVLLLNVAIVVYLHRNRKRLFRHG